MHAYLASGAFGFLAVLLLGGCSFINAPSEGHLATGGSGATGAGGTTGGTAGTGGVAECANDGDCSAKATDCNDSVCMNGTCTPSPKDEGTACGAAPASSCDLADTCDGNGACTNNTVADGTFCSDCAAGAGKCTVCKAGACGDCSGSRASEKSFRTPLSASGWTFTGGWRIYDRTPPSSGGAFPSVTFAHPVLGTDGNRSSPYPGGEYENSSATSPPTIMPPTLTFLSWNWDEGYQYDLKAVQVSGDGQSWQSIAVCPQGGVPQFAFCNAWNPGMPRPADLWDLITLQVPPEFVGKVGYVRFLQDTKDGCCDWEQGWYVDSLNFATDCACAADADCSYLDTSCGTGACDGTKECRLSPIATGNTCTAAADADCSMPQCDVNGWCNTNFMTFENAECTTCPEGTGDCFKCSLGECPDCPAIQTFLAIDAATWSFTGSWTTASCVPPNSLDPMGSPCFPEPMSALDENTWPTLGNIGSRTGEFPFAGGSKVETSTVTTGPTYIPSTLTFKSWHQDRGGKDTFNLKDKKTIKGSTDGGMTWVTILSCEGNNTVPFCQPWPSNTNRAVDVWDEISLTPPAELADKIGILQISYDTVDAGEGWERGWYIDDANFSRCDQYAP